MQINYISKEMETIQYNKNYYYSFQDKKKFIDYFFPENISSNPNYSINIYGIQSGKDQTSIQSDNTKINIIICVENASYHGFYTHYIKYKDYNDEKIQVYFYNHIDKVAETDKYIAIPVIYTQINYFKRYYNTIQPSIYTPFKDKKFCIFVSNNKFLIDKKNKIKQMLESIDKCDNIKFYKKDLGDKSCYHSIEFLNILNKYKFVFVSENSYNDGYITEKIFNGFFARIIPIYHGCNKVNYYFNENTFINVNNISDQNLNDIRNKILKIKDNEDEYNNYINTPKINNNFNDEDYSNRLEFFFQKYNKELKNKTYHEDYKYLLYILLIILIIFIAKKLKIIK